MRILALPRRIWKSLHLFTWLVMLVVGAGLVIIAVPGVTPSELRSDTTYLVQAEDLLSQLQAAPKIRSFVVKRVHGWPKPWAATSEDVPGTNLIPSLQPTPSVPIPSWCLQNAWPYFAADTRVDVSNLIVDLIAVLAVLFSFGTATEFWLHRRGGLLRFRILDMLVAVTCFALTLGWYQYHARAQRKELALASEITGVDWGTAYDPRVDRRIPYPGSDSLMVSEFNFTGPDWLLRLCGGARMLPALNHRTSARVFVSADWKDDVSDLEAWPYLREIEFFSVLPHSAIQTLGKLTRLKSLSIRTHEGVTHEWMLGRYDLLNQGGLVGPHDYGALACLRLERLTLENRELTAEDVGRIARELPTLKVLTLIEPMATPEEIEQLRKRYLGLTIIVDWPIELPPAPNPTSPATEQQRIDALMRLRAEAIKKQVEEANSAL